MPLSDEQRFLFYKILKDVTLDGLRPLEGDRVERLMVEVWNAAVTKCASGPVRKEAVRLNKIKA